MTDGLGTVEEPPEKIELERLKAEYRRRNIGLDRSREHLEEDVAKGWYTEEQANEMSARFEESGREMLAEIQARIEAHCAEHGLPR